MEMNSRENRMTYFVRHKKVSLAELCVRSLNFECMYNVQYDAKNREVKRSKKRSQYI